MSVILVASFLTSKKPNIIQIFDGIQCMGIYNIKVLCWFISGKKCSLLHIKEAILKFGWTGICINWLSIHGNILTMILYLFFLPTAVKILT